MVPKIVLLAAVACFASVGGSVVKVEPLPQPQPYKFGYSVKDVSSQQYREEAGNGAGVVTGSYGFTDANGIQRQVNYIADAAGFRAQVKTNEPGTANQNPADVEVISNTPVATKLIKPVVTPQLVQVHPTVGLGGIRSQVLNKQFLNSGINSRILNNGLLNKGLLNNRLLNRGLLNNGILNRELLNNGVLNTGLLNSNVLNNGLLANGVFNTGFLNSNILNSGFLTNGVLNTGFLDSNVLNNGILNAGLLNGGLNVNANNILNRGLGYSNFLLGGPSSANYLNDGTVVFGMPLAGGSLRGYYGRSNA
ncbi:Cuticle protein 16.8, partial [Stegodyphus mimosarum]